jgi:hypothetical protein
MSIHQCKKVSRTSAYPIILIYVDAENDWNLWMLYVSSHHNTLILHGIHTA